MLKYASGEEPRVGDRVRDAEIGEGVVEAIANHGGDIQVKWDKYKSERAYGTYASTTTLVTRADGIAARPSPAREVLGVDKFGATIRKGDRVRCGCGNKTQVECPSSSSDLQHSAQGDIAIKGDDNYFTTSGDGDWCVHPEFAILVTTSTPIQDTTPAPPPVVEEAKTYRVCPACDERITGAACDSAPCRRVAKCVAARKVEEATRAIYERFDAHARAAVRGVPVVLTTDYSTRLGYPSFFARLDYPDGAQWRTEISGANVEVIGVQICKAISAREQHLGARALRGGR
jgi:hypothetical protein